MNKVIVIIIIVAVLAAITALLIWAFRKKDTGSNQGISGERSSEDQTIILDEGNKSNTFNADEVLKSGKVFNWNP